MNVLVTGGAGYIGSHAAQKLREAGHDVVIYDNLSNGFKQAALGGELIVADVNDEPALSRAFDRRRFDAVMHFAASIYTDESIEKPLEYYANNVAGLLQLLHQCRRCNVARFVFSSSAAVYASSDRPLSEDAPLGAISPYGWSKQMGEQILLDLQRAGEIRCAILRYYNAAGADAQGRLGESGVAHHLIKVASQAAVGARDGMTIYGTDYDTPDGTCVRDYIHVDDLAQIHLDALERLVEQDDALLLNCGYGHGYSVKEVVAAVKRVTGVDFAVHEGPRRTGDSATLVADDCHLRATLGWEPAHDDLDAIVRSAYRWERKLQAGAWRE